jgi:DNA-binding NarL/FixJ family response regulator
VSVVRILLADDHLLVRAGIRSLIENIPGTTVVAEANNGREAVALARAHHPDLVMMDITMKELNGIDAMVQILALTPPPRVIMLSMHSGEDFVQRALKCGAHGYLVKDSAPLELPMAIAAVMAGEMYLSPRVSRQVVTGLTHGSQAAGAGPSIESLTARQREILQLVAEGKSTKEIAFVLGVSAKTVESHRADMMTRLRIRDIAGLVVFAIRCGLIDIDSAPR